MGFNAEDKALPRLLVKLPAALVNCAKGLSSTGEFGVFVSGSGESGESGGSLEATSDYPRTEK